MLRQSLQTAQIGGQEQLHGGSPGIELGIIFKVQTVSSVAAGFGRTGFFGCFSLPAACFRIARGACSACGTCSTISSGGTSGTSSAGSD